MCDFLSGSQHGLRITLYPNGAGICTLTEALSGLRFFGTAEAVDRPVSVVSADGKRLRVSTFSQHVLKRECVATDVTHADCRVDVALEAGVFRPLAEGPVLRQLDGLTDVVVLVQHGLVEGVKVVLVLQRRYGRRLRQLLKDAPMHGHEAGRQVLDLDRRVVEGMDYRLPPPPPPPPAAGVPRPARTDTPPALR